MECSPPGSSVHGGFPGKKSGVSCHSLLQGIFLTQGLNPCLLCLLYWQADCLPTEPPGKPQRHVWCSVNDQKVLDCFFSYLKPSIFRRVVKLETIPGVIHSVHLLKLPVGICSRCVRAISFWGGCRGRHQMLPGLRDLARLGTTGVIWSPALAQEG